MNPVKKQFVGQLTGGNVKPTNIELVVDERAVISSEESSSGIVTVNGDYDPGDPRRYGAEGDGTTDDYAALQTAMDIGIPVLIDDANTYLIGSNLTLTRDVVFVGDGTGTIKGSVGTEQINSTYSIQASDVKFDNLGVTFRNTGTIASLDVRRCTFNEIDEVYSTSDATNTQTALIFIDNKVDTCGRGLFVKVDNITNAYVHGNRFTNLSTALDQSAAIRLGNDVNSATYPATRRNFIVTDNHIDTVGSTLTNTRCWGICTFGDHSIISNNFVKDITVGDSNGAEGIYTKSRYGSVTNNILIDAADSSSQAAITIKGDDSSTRGSDIVVANNEVYSDGTPNMYGIWTEVERCTITNNIVNGTSLGGIGTGQRTMSNLVISNNEIYTIGRYGINITCDGENLSVHGNNISGVTNTDADASSYGIIVQSQAADIDRLRIYRNNIDIDSTSSTSVVGGIAITTQAARSMTDVFIERNVCTIPTSLTPTTNGIIIQGVADIITRLHINNNSVHDTDEGIDLQVSVKDLFMRGNKLETIATTDATVTNTLRIPLSDESLYRIEASFVGKEDTTDERCMYQVAGLFYRNGGNATLEGSIQSVYAVETTAGLDGTLAVSGGNDVLARVTGLAATNMSWNTDLIVQSVS